MKPLNPMYTVDRIEQNRRDKRFLQLKQKTREELSCLSGEDIELGTAMLAEIIVARETKERAGI